MIELMPAEIGTIYVLLLKKQLSVQKIQEMSFSNRGQLHVIMMNCSYSFKAKPSDILYLPYKIGILMGLGQNI